MRVRIETRLSAPAEKVWLQLKSPDVLRHVAAPMLRFRPVDPPDFPALWGEGDYLVSMWFLGVLPLGRQEIRTRFLVAEGWPRLLQDDGRGLVVRRWDHRIEIEPDGDAATRYVDEVDIEAGLLTLPVWLFAHIFYRHRQRRWRALARQDFAQISGREGQ
jgi:hypothetical protein